MRYEQEKEEYEANMAKRAETEKARGRKLGGKKPVAPTPGPKPKDQVNLTDFDIRIMPVAGGGFEQAYNAKESVDMETLIIIGEHVSQQPNDKQELDPALEELRKLPEQLPQVQKAALDSGYKSSDKTKKLESVGIELL